MSQPLTGQVAVITGSSRGIGRASALALAAQGANIVINYARNETAAQEAAAACEQHGVKTLVVQADVAQPDEAQALIRTAEETFGRVDILVNNAGTDRGKTIQRLAIEDWDDVLRTNLSSAFYVTQAVIAGMRERSYGRIINMASILGQTGSFGQANYASSKAGLVAFTKSAAQELARFNITVNAVCPGWIETDMSAKLPDEMRTSLIEQIPLGRFGKPEEVADTVAFLCLPSSGWYTGSQFNMNGGQFM